MLVEDEELTWHPGMIEIGNNTQAIVLTKFPPQTLPAGARAAILPCEARGQEQTVWLRDGVPVLVVEGPRYRLGERNRLEIRGEEGVDKNAKDNFKYFISILMCRGLC